MLFISAPQRKSRMPALGASALAHGVLIAAMMLISAVEPHSAVRPVRHKYFVRFVQLQAPREYRRPTPAPKPKPAVTAQVHAPAKHEKGQAKAPAPLALAKEHKQFKLPRNVRVQQVKQTLVQMDLPPDIKLKHDMPLPTALLWTETTPPPMRRRFIAPPVRKATPKLAQSLPSAPALSPPNGEVNPAELSIASVIPTEMPHLVHPPSVASPVSRAGKEPAKEIPQIGLAESAQPSAANLISLPANPLRASTLLVLPPANQIAPSDAGNAGSPTGSANGTGEGGHETAANGTAAGASNGNKLAASAGTKGTERATATGTTGAGSALAGNGHWTASGSAGTLTDGNALKGATRIELPKEGKFGVVVLGSAASGAYPESVGALGGKVVYTVYLKVGLRKSWILQYCLPKAAGSGAAGGRSSVPVDAPWPFLIMRPDQWSASDPDYIIVHGMLTAAGKFDQLAMVFPDELDKKQLILKSLKLWAFRPASRDGVPVSVEVLLIIPREAE
jgi:hypothetical protein